jgi:predicted DNA-binding transcriptional regulator YafY
MPEDPPLVRHWNLLRLLAAHRHGATVREMAQQMGVGEKTIRRDLEFLETRGVRLEDVVGDHGRKAWRLAGDWSPPPLTFTFEEAAALYLGHRFLEPMIGTPFWPAAESAWRKIRSTFRDSALQYIDRFAGLFHCTTGGLGKDPPARRQPAAPVAAFQHGRDQELGPGLRGECHRPGARGAPH